MHFDNPLILTGPCQAREISALGVDYLWLKTPGGGDLYLTRFGRPFKAELDPANWHAPDWFSDNRRRLPGTSVIFKLHTRPVRGVSLDIVARYSRVGETVPIDTLTLCRNIHAEFNSPFEEFARVMELRAASALPNRKRILTKRPLAIYAPGERLELWQTGRSESKFEAKLARHPGAGLDILRQYILVYGWIDGLNIRQAADWLCLTGARREELLEGATLRAAQDLENYRFRMLDMKPEHVILRVRADGSLLRRQDGELAYGLVDYELLERLPQPERATAAIPSIS
jgi:hypothetical protein